MTIMQIVVLIAAVFVALSILSLIVLYAAMVISARRDPLRAELLALAAGRSKVVTAEHDEHNWAVITAHTSNGWIISFGLDPDTDAIVDVDGAGRFTQMEWQSWDDWDDSDETNPGVWMRQNKPAEWAALRELLTIA